MSVVLVVVMLIAGYFIWRMNSPARKSQMSTPRGAGHTANCHREAMGNDNVLLGEYYRKTHKVTAYAQGGRPPKERKTNLRGSL